MSLFGPGEIEPNPARGSPQGCAVRLFRLPVWLRDSTEPDPSRFERRDDRVN